LRQLKPRALRVPVNLPVVIQLGASSFQAIALNLGMGGVLVGGGPVLSYDERVEVVVELPGLPGPSRLPGLVRWRNDEGFGVQFQSLGARETYAIGALMSRYHQIHTATGSSERTSYRP